MKHPHLCRLLAMAALSLPGALAAQSLWQAMALAYDASPDLRDQRAAQGALREDANQAEAGWRPTVNVSVGAGRTDNRIQFHEGDRSAQNASPRTVRLAASQPIWNGSTGPRIDAAQTRVRQGSAQLRQREQSVLQASAQAYLGVLRNGELVRLSEVNAERLAQEVTYREALFARELGTRTELAQAQARHATARAELQRARNDLDSSVREFERQIGVPPTALILPEVLPPIPASLDVLLGHAEREAPSVLVAEHALAASGYDVQAARGTLLPSVALEAGVTRVSDPIPAYRNQQDGAVQVTVSIPLYQGGGALAATRASEQRSIQARAQLDSARLGARQSAVLAWNGWLSAQADVVAFTEAVAANAVAYQGMREQFDILGELTLLEVLDMQRELFNAQVSLVRAQVQAVQSQLDILAAQGKLTADALLR